jgi:hypothetical protein
MFEVIVVALLVVLVWQTWTGNALMTQLLKVTQKAPLVVPFPDDVIEKHTETTTEAWLNADRARDQFMEQYGGKTVDAHGTLQMARLEDLYREAKRERRFLDEMIEANARVRSGKELLSHAYDRVTDANLSRELDDIRHGGNPDGPVQTS